MEWSTIIMPARQINDVEDIDMKKRNFNPAVLIGSIFGGIGLVFLIVGLCSFISGSVNKNKGEEITAVVTAIERYRGSDGDTSHRVYVDYEYDGKEYTDMPLNYYSSSMRRGKKISITIDPDEPENILSTGVNLMLGGIFGGIGLIFTVLGGAFLLRTYKRKSLAGRLVEGGYYVDAQIDCVDTANVRINGRPTYVIRCNYLNPNDGKLYSFTSEIITFDPTPLIDRDTLRVYVDKNDFSKNYVDISEFKDKYIEC